MARSLEQIKNDHTTVPALRKECARLKIKYVIRDGGEIAANDGRKHELIEAISKYEVEQEMKRANPIVEPTTDPVVEPTTDPVVEPISDPVVAAAFESIKDKDLTIAFSSEAEQLLKRLASKYYQGFKSGELEIIGVKQFAQIQMERAENNQSLMDTRLFTTVAYFKEEITLISSDNSETGIANACTTLNLRTEIINRIKKAVTLDREQFTVIKDYEGMEPVVTDYLTQAYNSFRSGVIASFSQIAREKRETSGSNFLERRMNTPHATVTPLIQWAIKRLKSPLVKAQEWREVVLAIMIVTGRRPAEVLSTGVFKAIDQTNLEFYGQLKKKGESDETIYKIPAIGDTAKEVEVAIGWLEMMNKRVIPASRSLEDKQLAAKKSHDRFSTYMSIIASKIMPDHLALADGASWELDENRSRIKPYLARQIYLQILSKMVQKAITKGVSIDPDLALTYYSGHYLSVDGKDTNAENYLADIVISDLNEIEALWNWLPDLTAKEIKSLQMNAK